MPLRSPLELPATADMHVHLRQDPAVLATVVPSIRAGGADTVYVMPNLTPPLTEVSRVLAYHKQLQELDSSVTYVMTLYLHPSITPDTIAEAAATGGIIQGVKAYPAGVTTNSAAGVLDWRKFWPVFGAMEKHDLVLNIHGEVPPSKTEPGQDEGEITVFTAEEKFLPTLLSIHAAFPRLRIVLEHCTSAAALSCVRTQCSPTVACTITAHHLWITADAWENGEGKEHNWCKPAAKTEADRKALVQAVVSGDQKVMFGSDSAPHPASAKMGSSPAAGCFTQGWTTQLVIGAIEEGYRQGWIKEHEVAQERIAGFLGGHARRFYKLKESTRKIIVEKKEDRIPPKLTGNKNGVVVEIVPFRSGEKTWSLSWMES